MGGSGLRCLGRRAALVCVVSVSLAFLRSDGVSATGDRTVRGKLMFAGRPVTGAAVLLAPGDEVAANVWPDATGALAARTAQTRTDARGEFRFSGLEARQWSLYVRAPGFVPFVQRIALDGSVLEAHVDATLLPAAILRGHVSDPKGGSVGGVTVGLSSMDPVHTLEYPDPRTLTDARGRFELGQVAAGQYWLEAYAADGRMSATKLHVTNAEPLARDLQLSPPDDPGTVRLRVMDDAGRPVAGAWVGGTGPEHRTDAAGRWFSRRYPQDTIVSLYVSPNSRLIQAPAIRPPFGKEVLFTLPGGTIEVKAPGRALDLLLILRGPGWRDPEGPYGRPDGAVMRFEGAKGGHWSIWAHDSTHRMGHAEFDLPVGGRLTMDAPLDVKGGSVRGRFVDDHGRPVAGVEVSTNCWVLPFGVRPDGTRSFQEYALGVRETRTDAEGRFGLADLYPGAHVLFFNGRHGVSRMLVVLVPAGNTTPVDTGDVAQSDDPWRLPLVMTPEGIVVGRPDLERQFHRARGLKRGDLVVAIDGQPLDGSEASLALALLDGPGRHDLLVRGPHSEIRVACPPGRQGMHLPFVAAATYPTWARTTRWSPSRSRASILGAAVSSGMTLSWPSRPIPSSNSA